MVVTFFLTVSKIFVKVSIETQKKSVLKIEELSESEIL